jgi:hypothetical protein
MTAMTKSPDRAARGASDEVRLAAVTGAGWIVLAAAAWIYARMKGIPEWTALPVTAAFLIEFPFYLFPGFEASREWLAGFHKPRAAWILTASAIAPWLVYSLATGEASVAHLAVLLLIALVVSFWYVVLPTHRSAGHSYPSRKCECRISIRA